MDDQTKRKIRSEIRANLAGSPGPVDLLAIAIALSERHGAEITLDQYKLWARIEADELGVSYVS